MKKLSNSCKIMGYGHRERSLITAREMGAIDDFTTDSAASVKDADLIVLCTPVGTFDRLLREIAPALKAGAIVTDVGEHKRSVCRLAEQILPPAVQFIGSHPMAGSEKRGVEAATADLFRGALCITTPTPRTNPRKPGRSNRSGNCLECGPPGSPRKTMTACWPT